MISSYFTPGSYDRKGPGPYVLDRLKRLGIPLLFYIVVIDPLLSYVLARYSKYVAQSSINIRFRPKPGLLPASYP